MEKANYPGDPGGYRKKFRGVRTKEKCREDCKRDPHCCHWVHYGSQRGNSIKFKNLILQNLYSVTKKWHRWGANTCFFKKKKSAKVQRKAKQVNNGPVFAGSVNCGDCKCGVDRAKMYGNWKALGGTETTVSM